MTQTRPIFASSDTLKQKRSQGVNRKFQAECEALEIGQSFSVGKDEIKFVTFRPMISRLAKKLEMKLRVVEHKEHNCYEVGRIA